MSAHDTQHAPPGPLIVGLGASAGGLAVLEQFFSRVPKDCGLAFVVVQHLAPQHASMLGELLGRRTTMPVVEAQNDVAAQADHVYVIAPGTTLGIAGGCLRVVPVDGERRGLIDAFLSALAEDQGERAVGILLSGSGSDGTIGMQAIQRRGGLTLAQDPETAKYDAMPRAAIAAGAVHHALPIEEMPARLLERARDVAQGRGRIMTPAQAAVPPGAAALSDEQLAGALNRICVMLERKTGHDFSHYKRGTVLRRLRHRIQLRRATSLDEYLDFLGSEAQEPELLAKDLLISVTSFFRDPASFDYLGLHVLPQIFAAAREQESVRVWVPGCASGEEAYSIGILMRERLSQLGLGLRVQIFGTDIDSEAIAEARHARYPGNVVEHVSPERLARFFTLVDSSVQVGKEVREMCIFSEHSLIRDAPFGNVDLICCRNVLIYLDPELQKKLVPLFHYALRPGGFLFLGSAEGLAGHSELFDAIDKRFRLFKRRESESGLVDLPLVGRTVPRATPPARYARPPASQTRKQAINAAFERLMLQEHAPPAVVTNERGDVICVAGPTGRYLQPPVGILTTNVLDVGHVGLRIELRTALHAAVRGGAKVVRDDVHIEIDGVARRLRITVRPLPGSKDEQLFVIVIDERASGAGEVASGEPAPLGADRESAVEQLESELRTTRAELRTAVEELEGANEELTSSNEELLSTNEEMQSTNEELRSSQEELSSLNEELTTVNSELSRKVDELAQVNSDLANFFASTDVATVFVDRALRIQKFTPAARTLLRLIEADVGRPLADLAHPFADHDLAAEVRGVVSTLQPAERQVETIDHQTWYLLRILPYRTIENAAAGAVVTLADITRIKHVESELRRAKEYAEGIIATLPEPLLILNSDLEVQFASAAFYRRFGVHPSATQGRSIYDLGNGQWNIPSLRELLEKVLRDNTAFDGYQVDHVFESLGRRIMLINGRRLEDLQLILLVIGDVTERQLAAEALQAANARLEENDRNKNDFMAMLAHELRNPLAPIRNSLYVLEHAPKEGEDARRALAIIGRQAMQLTRLVDDLLDVSRIDRRAVVLHRERLDLGGLVRSTIEDQRKAFFEGEIEIEVSTPPAEVWVNGDRTRLAQVVGNLLGNAAKFTPPGGRTVVAVEADAAHGQAIIRVQDTGRGIVAEMLPRIFDPFTQADVTIDRKKGGLGLGLSLVKGLVEMHDGSVSVASDGRGKGATFTITLPLDTAAAVEKGQGARGGEIKARPRRVLVIEDNVDGADSLGRALTLMGHAVEVARSGPEGIEKARAFRPEIVLCDIGLPEMDGYQVARIMRADPTLGRVTLVALTGYAGPDDLAKAREAGFDAHLAKPATLDVVARMLQLSS